MRFILIGFKSSGKTTLGRSISKNLSVEFFDLDELIEKKYSHDNGEIISFREIFRRIGESNFRNLENRLLEEYISLDSCIISLGGGTLDEGRNRELLGDCCIVYVRVPIEDLLVRIEKIGYPSYLDSSDDPEKELRSLFSIRKSIYEEISHLVIDNPNSIDFEKLILDSSRKISNLMQNNESN
ncbi:MAG: shikimate kinase [Nitrospinota bacterium]|nr:shikimate kinase [Nitrospinota bacterium]